MRFKRIFTIFGFLAGFCVLALTPVEALALVRVKALSTVNVTQFIKKTSKITSGQATNMTPEKMQKYLEAHLDKNARFKSTMKYNMPNMPTQESALSLNKKKFIASISEGQKSIDDYVVEIEILSIDISEDGRNAIVQTQSTETGTMPISPPGMATKDVPIEGSSVCNQVIGLSKKNVIQMVSAQCETTINFESLEETFQ